MRPFIADRIILVLITVAVATTGGFASAVTTDLIPTADRTDWMHVLALGQIALWVAIVWVFAISRRGRAADDGSDDSRYAMEDEWAAFFGSVRTRIAAAWNAAMDQLNDAVKDAVLDWRPTDTDPDPDPEVKLRPLDRHQFAERLSPKLAEVLAYVADTVSAPRTDMDLANAEADVGRLLHELRWDALTIALELRSPNDAYQTVPLSASHGRTRRQPPEPPAARPTGNWAKKYRRMKAMGY